MDPYEKKVLQILRAHWKSLTGLRNHTNSYPINFLEAKLTNFGFYLKSEDLKKILSLIREKGYILEFDKTKLWLDMDFFYNEKKKTFLLNLANRNKDAIYESFKRRSKQ